MHNFLKAIRQADNKADYSKLCAQFKDQINQLIPGEISRDYDQALLHYAAALNNVELAAALIGAGATVDIKDKLDCTPLHRAAYRQATGVMELLIKAGADLSAQNKDGLTPAHLAAQSSFVDGLRLLTAAGANINIPDNDGALPIHYISGTLLDLHELLCRDEAWYRLVETEEDDQTEDNTNNIQNLEQNAENKALVALLFLLEHGTLVDVVDSQGNTLLIKNIVGTEPAIVETLIAHGADINHVNSAGETALHYLIKELYCATSDACMAILLKHGARLDLADNNGQTPLDLAKITKQRTPEQRRKLVEILEQAFVK